MANQSTEPGIPIHQLRLAIDIQANETDSYWRNALAEIDRNHDEIILFEEFSAYVNQIHENQGLPILEAAE